MADSDLSAAMIPGFFAIGFSAWGYFAAAERRQMRRLFRGKIVRIADAPDTGRLRIQGTVVAGELGTIESRVGEPVVWSRLVSEDLPASVMMRIDHSNTTTLPASSAVNRRPFFVDDGSGELALILPDAANLGFKLGELVRLEPTRRMDSTEEIIAIGDRVSVYGTAARKETPDGYRIAGARYLELAGGPGRELLVSNLAKQPTRVLGTIAFYARSLLTLIFIGLTLLVIVDALR
jgi:hypothetical protein